MTDFSSKMLLYSFTEDWIQKKTVPTFLWEKVLQKLF